MRTFLSIALLSLFAAASPAHALGKAGKTSTFKVINKQTHEVFKTGFDAAKAAMRGLTLKDTGKPGEIHIDHIEQLNGKTRAYNIVRQDEHKNIPMRVEVEQVGHRQFIFHME